jgi:hypothetical protein
MTPSPGRIATTYDYTDENGQLLYQAVRYEPKDFRQRRPDGKGGWVWNLNGVRLVLYRLPELARAPSSRPVFVAEGEKDVDRLTEMGLVATTNAMGAGKWRLSYAEALTGREVVILPDNDDPGRKHAQQVAQSLQGKAASVKVVDLLGLPPKGDVSDWLALPGNDKDKLLQMVLTAKAPSAPATPTKPKTRYRSLPAYMPFPLECLPPVLRDLVDAGSAAIGCDPAFIAVPALAVAAGCIGNSRSILLKHGWVEPCVIWSMTVAESGGHKSPGYDLAVAPLLNIHHDADDVYQQELQEYEDQVQRWKSTAKETRGEKPLEPVAPPTYLTDDCTIEAVAKMLKLNAHGLIVATEELSAWFGSFTRYKSGGGSDQPRWLSLHGAKPLRVDRAGSAPISVRRAAVSITGTIQPVIVTEALDRKAMQSGLGPRFLLAMPPQREREWSEAEVAEELAERYQEIIFALQKLELKDVAKRHAQVLTFSPHAKELWVAFYNSWGRVQHASHGEQRSAFAKIEAYGARLALLHHVVSHIANGTSDLCPISAASVQAGIDMARWFAAEGTRIYAMLREPEGERETRKLVEWIQGRGGRVSVRVLQKSNSSRWLTSDVAEAAIDDLVKGGLGEWQVTKNTLGGHDLREFVLTHPTHDTSDTRNGDGDENSEPPSDTRSDTRFSGRNGSAAPHVATPNGETVSGNHASNGNGRVSEVSCVGQVGGGKNIADGGEGGQNRVSERVSEGTLGKDAPSSSEETGGTRPYKEGEPGWTPFD